MKKRFLALLICWTVLAASPAWGINFGPFGEHGEGGTRNGQTFNIGAGGSVYELNAFLSVPGLDLNGNQVGQSADLSRDPLPAGFLYQFSSQLSTNTANLLLSYAFTNTSAVTFTNANFFVLLDAEIDKAQNTFSTSTALSPATSVLVPVIQGRTNGRLMNQASKAVVSSLTSTRGL